VVGDDEAELVDQELVVAEVGGPAGAAVDAVHQVDVGGRSLADALHDRDRAAVDHPGDHHLRVQVEAGEPVAAYGAGVGAGGEHAAQAASAVVQRRGHELRADAPRLVLGEDGERRQDPHQLPHAGHGAAHDLPVDLGDPAAPRIRLQRAAGATDPVLVAAGGTACGVGPVALRRAEGRRVVARGGDLGEVGEITRTHRPDDRRGHDTWAA